MENNSSSVKDLLASLVNATKTYVGNDPLQPWLQGVKKMKEILPPDVVRQKLPRFLEKCTQNFVNDRRYRNDLRYLQLWIQLLEFVPNANRGEVLSVMERNNIGAKHALYYQAYALHYEKLKKFAEAEAMYKLGTKRLAEPAESLQQSYDGFLQRIAYRNRRKPRSRQSSAMLPSEDIHTKGNVHYHCKSLAEQNIQGGENESESYPDRKWASAVTYLVESPADGQTCYNEVVNGDLLVKDILLPVEDGETKKGKVNSDGESNASPSKYQALNEETNAVGNDSSILAVHKSAGLAIRRNNSNVPADIRSGKTSSVKGFEILADICCKSRSEQTFNDARNTCTLVNNFQGLTQREDRKQNKDGRLPEQMNHHKHMDEGSDSINSLPSKFCTEDTVIIRKFVDSSIVGDTQEIEDAYHHGLIEPTIITKEAMADINDMFGKPLNLEKSKSVKQTYRIPTHRTAVKISNGETPIIPLAKDFEVFVDENLINNSFSEVNSSKNFATVQVLQSLSDNNLKGAQNETCLLSNKGKDQGLSSVPKEICQDRISIAEKNRDKQCRASEGKNGHRHFRKTGEISMFPKSCSEETMVIRKFVDSAIIGDGNELEAAFHHGLVEPTINTKAAMEEINNMFLEPLQVDKPKTIKRPLGPVTVNQSDENFLIFVDDDLQDEGVKQQCLVNSPHWRHENLMNNSLGLSGALKLSEVPEPVQQLQMSFDECNKYENKEPPFQPVDVFQDSQFSPTANLPSKSSNEDTIIIRKIVDSAIVDSEIEEACHHGLVDPTITTKEAMADINNMFSKSLPFDNTKKSSQPLKVGTFKQSLKGSWILPDEDIEKQILKQQDPLPNISKEQDSSLPSVKEFQIFIDENVHDECANKHLNKSCLSVDTVDASGQTDENSPDMQETPCLPYADYKDVDVCMPTECFKVFIDKQFQEQEHKDNCLK